RRGDLAEGGPSSRSLDRQIQEISLAGSGTPVDAHKRFRNCGVIPLLANAPQAFDLLLPNRRVVDAEDFDVILLVGRESVHSYDDVLSGIDSGLLSSGNLFDARHRNAGLNGFRH